MNHPERDPKQDRIVRPYEDDDDVPEDESPTGQPKTLMEMILASGVSAKSRAQFDRLDGKRDWFKGGVAVATLAPVLSAVLAGLGWFAVNAPTIAQALAEVGISPGAVAYVTAFGVACGSVGVFLQRILSLRWSGPRVTKDPKDPARPDASTPPSPSPAPPGGEPPAVFTPPGFPTPADEGSGRTSPE